nr:MAG TPA: hypothetical protein [Caudoviricetes sp.]
MGMNRAANRGSERNPVRCHPRRRQSTSERVTVRPTRVTASN